MATSSTFLLLLLLLLVVLVSVGSSLRRVFVVVVVPAKRWRRSSSFVFSRTFRVSASLASSSETCCLRRFVCVRLKVSEKHAPFGSAEGMDVSTLSSKSTNLSRMRSTVGFKSRSSFVQARRGRRVSQALARTLREKALFSSFVGNNTNDDDELGFEKYSRVFSILKYSFEYSVNISSSSSHRWLRIRFSVSSRRYRSSEVSCSARE